MSSEQKRKIAELEYQVTTDRTLLSAGDISRNKRILDSRNSPPPVTDTTKSPSKSKKSLSDKKSTSKKEHKITCKKASSVKQSVSQRKIAETADDVPPLTIARCCCEAGGCLKNMKELLDKEMEYRQVQVSVYHKYWDVD